MNPAIKYDTIGIDVQELLSGGWGGPCLNHFSMKNGELGLPEDNTSKWQCRFTHYAFLIAGVITCNKKGEVLAFLEQYGDVYVVERVL